MSWTDYIVKFKKQEQASIEWKKAVELSKKYGLITNKENQKDIHELVMEDSFGIVNFHGNTTHGISMISIDRPTENELIRPFIFDYLTTFDMILCDQNFTHGVSAIDLKEHIPKGTLLDGVKIVKEANQIYS